MPQVRNCFSKLVAYYISNKNYTCEKNPCKYHAVSSGKRMVYFMCMVIITIWKPCTYKKQGRDYTKNDNAYTG